MERPTATPGTQKFTEEIEGNAILYAVLHVRRAPRTYQRLDIFAAKYVLQNSARSRSRKMASFKKIS